MSADFIEVKFQQLDQVRLITTRNVNYVSAPPDAKVSPHGIWSVAAIVDGLLLLVKENTTIRIPAADVLKVSNYNIDEIVRPLGRLTDGKEREEEDPYGE